MDFSAPDWYNKSRFHHIRGQKLQMSWFLHVLTCYWAPKPRWFIFGETRIPQKISESIWEHPGKHIIYENVTLKQIKNYRKLNPHFLNLVFVFICWILFLYVFWIYILKNIFYEDEEREMIYCPLIKSTKAWIWILFMSKNMNRISP